MKNSESPIPGDPGNVKENLLAGRRGEINGAVPGQFAFIRKVVVEDSEATRGAGFFRDLLQRVFQRDALSGRERRILQARRELGRLGVSIADLNEKIERLDRITAKWKARGSVLDVKS